MEEGKRKRRKGQRKREGGKEKKYYKFMHAKLFLEQLKSLKQTNSLALSAVWGRLHENILTVSRVLLMSIQDDSVHLPFASLGYVEF